VVWFWFWLPSALSPQPAQRSGSRRWAPNPALPVSVSLLLSCEKRGGWVGVYPLLFTPT
jgi:hypothetical protein